MRPCCWSARLPLSAWDAPAVAQNATAALRGQITENGQPAGVQATAVQVDTGFRQISPITNGNYNFPALRPGQYRIEVQTANGTRQTDVFSVQVGQNLQLNFDLAQPSGSNNTPAATEPSPNAPAETATSTAIPAAGGNDIIVTGSRIHQLEGGEVGINITQHTIDSLPQNNRNFLAFADLSPGVQFVTNANGNQSLRGGAQPVSSINVFIDGVSQKDNVLAGGITGQDSSSGNPFPQLGIAEYRGDLAELQGRVRPGQLRRYHRSYEVRHQHLPRRSIRGLFEPGPARQDASGKS